MLTNARSSNGLQHTTNATASAAGTQKVVIVNGSSEILELLETVLDGGRYDVVFVESSRHAYSQIKRVQPNLVILCLRISDAATFQVLSMLKLDEETRSIPVLTYATPQESEDSDDEAPERTETELFTPKPAVWMN
jgi:PleD family two-component response regulator